MITAFMRRSSSHRPFTRRRSTSCPYHLLELIIKRSPPASEAAAAARLISSNRAGIRISSSICFIQHHVGSTAHHQRASRLSTISSSPLDDNPNLSSIKVTVTSNAPTTSCHHDSAEESSSSSSSSSSSNHPKKSPDQIAEEEILSLQSELRVHYRHASYDTALDTANQLLSLTMKQFGKLHPATASAYNNVGLMNKCLGKYVEAREAYHEALRIYGEVCGKDHASYAAALSNLGMLERGRVLESEGASDDGEEVDSGNVNNEDGVDLEELRDSNTHIKPTKLSALERMQLNETAIEYFDEAYRIRLSELGSSHPHTITSRSQLGAAMAASVIAERRGRVGGLLENELRQLKQVKKVRDTKEMEAYVPEALAKAASKTTLSGSKLTRRRWEAAEEHLRGALTTAVENPRGESVRPLMIIPTGNRQVHAERTDERRGLTMPSKEDKSGLSKKEKKLLGKERLREKRRANVNTLQSRGVTADGRSDNGNEGAITAVLGVAAKVTTLSAATAAQNLAVFLKNYSDWIRLSLLNEKNPQQSSTSTVVLLDNTIQEAQHLYESALHVRSSILPSHHPDVIATKFSLAELLDSPRVARAAASAVGAEVKAATVGEQAVAFDGERATQLREEILNAYNVEEREL